MELVKQQQIAFSTLKNECADFHALPQRDRQIACARYESVPIGHYPDIFFEEYKERPYILAWCALIGIRNENLPDEWSMVFITNFLRNDAGGLTFDEIFVALQMNLLGELPTKNNEPDIIDHYQAFNLPYLGKILKAYKEKRKQVDEAYLQVKFKFEKPKPKEPTFEELTWQKANMVYYNFTCFRSGSQTNITTADYDFLVDIGQVVVTSEDIYDRIEPVKDEIRERFLTNKDRGAVRHLGPVISDPDRFLTYAQLEVKYSFVREYFNLLIKSGEDVVPVLERATEKFIIDKRNESLTS